MTGPAPPSEALIRLALSKVQPLPSHVQQTPDPLQAMQKAQTIGPARVGERYQDDLNPSLVGIARKVLGGAQRPASVAAEDPYGIGAWLKGAGPMPTPIAAEIQAYHGSPHDFEKFLLEKIGTGEGAQAYGHGLYFAENPSVAAAYKKAGVVDPRDAMNHIIEDAKTYTGDDTQLRGVLASGLFRNPVLAKWGDSPEVLDHLVNIVKGQEASGTVTPAAINSYRIIDKRLGELPKGKMYEVSIKADPDQFLDWDKPLSQQPPKVKEALSKLAGERGLPEAEGGLIYQTLAHDLQGETMRPGMKHLPITDAKAQVADKLREAGIPGIKYLDQGSRVTPVSTFNEEQAVMDAFKAHRAAPTAETQKALEAAQAALDAAKNKPNVTHNYVVFDDKLIDILKKYAVAGAVGGSLASLGQQQTEEQK
jgi:hypothetical protein